MKFRWQLVAWLAVLMVFSFPAQATEQQPAKDKPTQEVTATRSGEVIDWQAINGGGGYSSSTAYQLNQSVSQVAFGGMSSASYGLCQAFWQECSGGGCCQNRGNVDGQFDGEFAVTVSDLTYLVAFLFSGGPAPPCEEEGNVDALYDGEFAITVSDLTYLVAFLFSGGPAPPPC